MSDPVDPVLETIWTNAGWREPFEALETDENGLEVAEDISQVTDIIAALKRRSRRGDAEAAVIEASLADETIVVTDAEAGLYEIRLPDTDDNLTAGGLVGGTWDLLVRFFRDGGVEEVAYVGVRELRKGWGSS